MFCAGWNVSLTPKRLAVLPFEQAVVPVVEQEWESIEISEKAYNVIAPENGVPVKAWTKGVPLEDAARQQLLNAAQLRFVFKCEGLSL